ncbi:MAG: hypothetical protein ABW193_06100 [Luteibacter sp.]
MSRPSRRRTDATYPARRIHASTGTGISATRVRSTAIMPAEAPKAGQGVKATLPDHMTFDDVNQFAPPATGTPSDIVDYILRKDEIGKPVSVHVPLNKDIDNGEEVTLILNAIDLETKVVDGDFSPMAFTIPAETIFIEGNNYLNYRFDYTEGAKGEDFGPGDLLTIDRIAPGADHSLAAPDVAADIKEGGLSKDKLVQLPDGTTKGLKLTLFSYEGLAYGDKIVAAAAGKFDTVVTELQYRHTGDIVVYVTEAKILEAGDGKIPFTYKITDRAGNESQVSAALILDVLVKGVNDLEEVAIPAYDDDPDGEELIDLADATRSEGVIVVVPWNTAFNTGDTINLYWGTSKITPYAITAEDVTAAAPIPLGVLYPAILEEWQATAKDADQIVPADVTYLLKRGASELGRAPNHTVQVNVYEVGGGDPDPETPGNDNLEKPVLVTAGKVRNKVEGEDFGKPATVEVARQTRDIEPKEVFQLDDVIVVTYEGTPLPEHTVVQADLEPPFTTPIVINMDAEVITDVGSGTTHLQYGIRRKVAGGTNTTLSPVQDIEVHGKDELPGDGGPLAACLHPEGEDTWMNLTKVNDGTLLALPIWTRFNAANQEVTVTANYFSQRDGSPITNRDYSQKILAPLQVVEAETAPQPEPDGQFRPPVEQRYIGVRIPRDKLVYLVPENRFFYIEVTYAVNNMNGDVTPVSSAKTTVKVDTRGS